MLEPYMLQWPEGDMDEFIFASHSCLISRENMMKELGIESNEKSNFSEREDSSDYEDEKEPQGFKKRFDRFRMIVKRRLSFSNMKQ